MTINNLELLMFSLNGKTKYGLEMLKVREVLKCPKSYKSPYTNQFVKWISTVRHSTLAIIDLNMFLGCKVETDTVDKFAIVIEYNHKSEKIAFLVNNVAGIDKYDCSQIKETPSFLSNSYLESIAQKGEEVVQILDIEKIINKILK